MDVIYLHVERPNSMAKSFIAINKGLGLYDVFAFGKYKGCRVDSIVEQDPTYIDYTRHQFGTLYDKNVFDAIVIRNHQRTLRDKRAARAYEKFGIAALFGDTKIAELEMRAAEELDADLYDTIYFDDIPF